MKTPLEKEFVRCGRGRKWMYQNSQIALRPREYQARVACLDGATSMIFDIVDVKTGLTAGEIALRLGESPGMFYLGHIGYHIDPPYQGRRYALQACRLCIPIFISMGMRSFVITTDEDNLPSISTCTRLGCVLESTVDVPSWCIAEYKISARKRRYVYILPVEPLENSSN